MSADRDKDLALLLDYLRVNRGLDFTGYKRATLGRRIEKRMEIVGSDDFADYLDYLEVHPEEFATLFNLILINVTGFFRDPATWDYLREAIIPRLLASRPPDSPIRAWCAACASGEEAYTLAMVLADALGTDQFTERVKIYATDIDEHALDTARAAVYTSDRMAGIPADMAAAYFDSDGTRHVFRKELRRSVIFGHHDLVADAPISRLDILTCRNALMYFNAEAQARIVERFHFALNPGGLLVLGRAETLVAYPDMFRPVDLRLRVFETIAAPARARPRSRRGASRSDDQRLRDAAFDTAPHGEVVIDTDGRVVLINRTAASLLGLKSGDVGRPLQEVEMSHRPPDLRAAITEARASGGPVTISDDQWTVPGTITRHVDIEVRPLRDRSDGTIGTSVVFRDVTALTSTRTALEHQSAELAAAYDDLHSTNDELETTNEELQSAIEELETTNEELASANEELRAINDELRDRSHELNSVNDYLEAILASLEGGVVVLDADMVVRIWNDRSADLWGLSSAEVVGTPFFNLDIGIAVEVLRSLIHRTLAGDTTDGHLEIAARNRRGQAFSCRVTCTALRHRASGARGVIVVMSATGASGN